MFFVVSLASVVISTTPQLFFGLLHRYLHLAWTANKNISSKYLPTLLRSIPTHLLAPISLCLHNPKRGSMHSGRIVIIQTHLCRTLASIEFKAVPTHLGLMNK